MPDAKKALKIISAWYIEISEKYISERKLWICINDANLLLYCQFPSGLRFQGSVRRLQRNRALLFSFIYLREAGKVPAFYGAESEL